MPEHNTPIFLWKIVRLREPRRTGAVRRRSLLHQTFHSADLLARGSPGDNVTAWGSRRLPMGKLQNKRAVGINWHLRAMMLDISRSAAKMIEAHAVGCRINQIEQPRTQAGPLRRVQLALEYRELDADTEVLAGACHATQTAPALPGKGAHVIGNEHEHIDHRDTKGGYPSRSPRRCAAISRACSCHRSPTASRSPVKGCCSSSRFRS